MFKIDKYSRLKIEVKLEPGVYIFDMLSATGKTYLYKKIEEYSSFGEPVIGFTYTDFVKGNTIADSILNNSYELAIIDRYDMYYGAELDAIEAFSKQGIVLIDTKEGYVPIDGCETCYIHLKEDKITVDMEYDI